MPPNLPEFPQPLHDRDPGPTLAEMQAAERIYRFQQTLDALTPRVWVTPLLLTANVAVFAYQIFSGVHFFQPEVADLLAWGANYRPHIGDEPWRLLASTFLHVGLLHLAMNLMVLWQIGPLVERLLGNLPFLAAYLLAGLVGSLTSVVWQPAQVSAGASGAIFGLYGVLGAQLLRHRASIPPEILGRLKSATLTFVILNLAIGLGATGIDMAAHLGGLLGGLLAGLVLTRPIELTAGGLRAGRALLALAAGVAGVGLAVTSLPPVSDVLGATARLHKVETQAISTFNRAIQASKDGQIDDAELLRRIEQDLLPPWRAIRKELAGMRGLPADQTARLQSIRAYLSAREEHWELLAAWLKTRDPKVLQQAQAAAEKADALAKGTGKKRK